MITDYILEKKYMEAQNLANIFIDNLLVRWGGCLVVFVVLVLYYKEDIKELIKKVKNRR